VSFVEMDPITPTEAMRRLAEGNDRFARNLKSADTLRPRVKREALVEAQSPFAIILSCSDSRVPSEIIFDQGLGDLFVIRVAGNIVAPSLVGSVEFAAAAFGSPLAVVVGHTRCGAVEATLDVLEGKTKPASENVRDIVERIRPAVEELVRPGASREEIMEHAIRANVRASVNHLRHGSRVLERLIGAGRLLVVGAEYSLESGEVTFFEGTAD
jgi:carbonic anhydrase